MNAVPISPPNNRLICSKQPIASASAGLIERTISASSAVSANDWPIAWRICEGQEIVGGPLTGQVGRDPAGDADQRAAERQHPTPVDPSQQFASGRAMTSCGRAIHSSTLPTCNSRKFCTVCR